MELDDEGDDEDDRASDGLTATSLPSELGSGPGTRRGTALFSPDSVFLGAENDNVGLMDRPRLCPVCFVGALECDERCPAPSRPSAISSRIALALLIGGSLLTVEREWDVSDAVRFIPRFCFPSGARSCPLSPSSILPQLSDDEAVGLDSELVDSGTSEDGEGP